MKKSTILQIVIPIIVAVIFWSTMIQQWNHLSDSAETDKFVNAETDKFVSTNIMEYQFNDTYHLEKPHERIIILRMDDIQGYLWKDISIKLIDTVLDKNMSIALGVIPMRDSLSMNNYLRSKVNDSRIEIVQHGTYHTKNEIRNISDEETYNLTKLGKEKIMKQLGIVPITYIPPYNSNQESSTKVLKRLGFKIFSSESNEFMFDGNMINIGFDTQTKFYLSDKLFPVKKIIDDCKLSLNHKNLCVVLIHPQDYVGNDSKTLDEGKYNEFRTMLDELKQLNATSITFKDLIK